MFTIENTNYGLQVTIVGGLDPSDAESWLQRIERALENVERPFGVLVDVREAKLFQQDAQAALKQGMEACAKAGMERATVVLNGAVATLQARRLARETGIASWQRYVDAASDPSWRNKALGWIVHGRDPES